MKAVRIILLTLSVILIGIQFIPSGIPKNKPEDEKSIVHSSIVTEKVVGILRNSCFDCHSNQTNFPWYSRVAPTSWLLADHINNGKSHLNFSEWENNTRRKKLGLLDDIRDEVESGAMPLKSYLLIHSDAKLDSNEVMIIGEWVKDVSAKMLEN